MDLSYYIRQVLEKLGMSEGKAFGYELKVQKFEDWLHRHPITNCYITFDPIFDDKFHRYSTAIDAFELKHTSGIWQKHFTWMAKASVEDSNAH